MKKILSLTLLAVLIATFVSCASTSVSTYSQFGEEINTVAKTPVDSNRFDVLGAVSMDCVAGSGASYVDIFNKAKELYGDVDEVINIHVDYKTTTTTTTSFNSSSSSAASNIIMTGLAIKYHK